MPTPENHQEKYDAARQTLWTALGFEPNKHGDGTLKEGDLYKVPRVTFKDGTPPKALLRRMLGKQLPSGNRRTVLNAILGHDKVLGLSSISKPGSKFNKIWQALGEAGARNTAADFIDKMVQEPTDPNTPAAKKTKETRNNFKLLLKEYLKKATTRTFNAPGRDRYRGDRILCCLLLLHYMTKDDTNLDVEIKYYPTILTDNKSSLLKNADLLKQICSTKRLDGVTHYFKNLPRKKLTYYDVVLPHLWDGKATSDFDSINKRKNNFEQLSTQYYDIAWGVNNVSTSEERLQITKFFVAAHLDNNEYVVFADQDKTTLEAIKDALFTQTNAATPVISEPDNEYITQTTIDGLLTSIDNLKDILVFDTPGADPTSTLKKNVQTLANKYMHWTTGQGTTYLRLLQDYEKIIEQMVMLKSLSDEQRQTFIQKNHNRIYLMLYGNPLPRGLVNELKYLNRKANVEQINTFAETFTSTLGAKLYAEVKKEYNATATANKLNACALWYNHLYPQGHIDPQTRSTKPIDNYIYSVMNGTQTPDVNDKTSTNLINFMKQMGVPYPTTNPDSFLQKLQYYAITGYVDGIPQFVNAKTQQLLNDALKNRKQSQNLQIKLNNPNYLKDLNELTALLNTQASTEEKLKQFQGCIESFYRFDWINRTDAQFQTQILEKLLYDDNTGQLTQMVKDLVKDVEKVKTVTSADLKREADKSKPTTTTAECTHYISMLTTDPQLMLNTNTQRFIPGQELFARINEALPKAGLKPNDILVIGGTASQTNGCESVNLHHAKISQQITDRTQGPTFNATSIKGTLKREEMYETGELKDCDTAKPLIEKLASMNVIQRVDKPKSRTDIGKWVPQDRYYNNHITHSYQEPIHNGKYAFYCNGYIQPATLNEAGEIALMDAMAYAPCSYMSQQNTTNNDDQNFIQNFAAAFSYQNVQNNSDSFTLPQIMMNLMWIYPQYDNVLKDAIRQSDKHPEKKLVIVHMPDIGQGAFGNPQGLTGLSLVLATIVNINKLTNSNIILQRNSIDGLDPAPANTLLTALNENVRFVSHYAYKLDKTLLYALYKFNRFSHLIKQRAIAFGYLDTNGNYNVPKAPKGQQTPQYQQYQQYQKPNPQMPNNMQYSR